MGWVLLVLLLLGVGAAVVAVRNSKRKDLERQQAELEPVKKLAFEDITALGTELQDLDEDLAGHELDKGTRADYQRALDAYESAKFSGDYMTKPEEITNVTKILDDGRYAIACVRARAAGQPLPGRRPACFFDPRHGMAVEDVLYAPPGGVERDVPACALDAERVKAGAEPDTRLVMVGSERVPYYQGGRAYAPYAAGYFGSFGPMEWMFMGMMFGGGFDGLGDGLGSIGDGIGDGIGSIGDGIGDMFGGFDF
jgi:hypothetical protein